MSSKHCDSRLSVAEDRTNSCGSLYANCNCNSAVQSSDKIIYNWNRLSDAEADPNMSSKDQLELRPRPRREHNSFSHPDTDVVFTKLPASRPEPIPSQDWDRELSYRLSQQEKSFRTNIDLSQSYGHNKIERAKQFFAQSGILGPTNFRDSSDLIRKTSRIHIDPMVREQIRKTSLCLRSRVPVGPEKSPDPVIGSWSPQESPNQKNCDDFELLTSLQEQVYALRGVIEHGETKIIMLRTEISKMKRILQQMSQSHALCLFCQPQVGCIDS